MKVLITGSSGFAGRYLVELCLERKAEVHGLDLLPPDARVKETSSKFHWHQGDLSHYDSVREIVKNVRPDRVFHLAAQTAVKKSWELPQATFQINVIGTLNLLEALRETGHDPLVHVAGSSEEYGLVEEHEIPIREENPLRPASPYAVSKVTQDLLGFQYFKSYRMRIVRTRAFNHTGPRRDPSFVVSDFSRQIAQIEEAEKPAVMQVGNLEAVRDFTDVRDIVQGYWLALEKGVPGEVYNLCSGRGIKIAEILNLLLQRTSRKIQLELDEKRKRPSDLPVIIGSGEKFYHQTGWKPLIPFEKTLDDLLAYWRHEVRSEKSALREVG